MLVGEAAGVLGPAELEVELRLQDRDVVLHLGRDLLPVERLEGRERARRIVGRPRAGRGRRRG